MQRSGARYSASQPDTLSSDERQLTMPFLGSDADPCRVIAPSSNQGLCNLSSAETCRGLVPTSGQLDEAVGSVRANDVQQNVERVDRRERIDYAVHARFAGGHGEPMHEWYPYLEGYSPAYVTTILRRYGQGSQRVLDPFAGTGTTPVTAVMLGLDAVYAEINPLCQTVSAAKLGAVALDDRQRRQIVDQLYDLEVDLRPQIRRLAPDEALRASYKDVFGRSEFFDPDVFNLALRTRTWIDRIEATSPRVAPFASIAVLRSLIPSSRL